MNLILTIFIVQGLALVLAAEKDGEDSSSSSEDTNREVVDLGTEEQVLKVMELDNPPDLPPAEDTLKYVFAVTRDGIRTPIYDPYPNDPAKADFVKYWGRGKGELTEQGEKLMRALGKTLYNRYKTLIDAKGTVKTVTSEKSPRTVKSAEILSEKLFGTRKLTSSDAEYMDKYLVFSETDGYCDRYQNFLKETRKELKEVLKKPLAEGLRRFTNSDHPLTIMEIIEILDTLSTKIENGKPVPKNLLHYHDHQYINTLMNALIMGDDWTGNTKYRYVAGPLLHEMYEHFEHCKEDCKGFHLHMTHALTLKAVIRSLHIYEIEPLPGTTILFELHKDNIVKVLVYQPLHWTEPGKLHQAVKTGTPLGVGVWLMCQGKEDFVDEKPLSCEWDTFKKRVANFDSTKFKEHCSVSYVSEESDDWDVHSSFYQEKKEPQGTTKDGGKEGTA